MLRRTPGFTAVVITVLALGIGANSAIFSIINAVLLRPLPYGDPDRLFRFEEVSPKAEASGIPPADMRVFRERVHTFEQVALSHWQNLTLSGPEGSENQFGGKVSSDGFAMLLRQPLFGRLFREEEFRPGAPKVVILSHQLWQRRFHGDRNVLARKLTLNGEPHSVIGVMPEDFFYDQRFLYWTPWQITAADTMRTTSTVRLRRGITRAQAEAESAAVFRDIGRDDAAKGWTVRLTQLSQSVTQRVRQSLLVSLGAVAFVVLIACLNVASLLLARASVRSHEFALRAAIGAGRGRLLRQALTEGMILSIGGGLAGLLLGYLGAKGLLSLFPERIPVPRLEQTRIDASVLLFTIGLALFAGLLSAVIPALQVTRADLNLRLKEGGRLTPGKRSRRLRNALVIAETALSLMLLVGAGLMLRSLARLMSVDPGFNPARILTVRTPLPAFVSDKSQQPAYYGRMMDRIGRIPGVNSVGLIAPLPLADINAAGTMVVEGRIPAEGAQQTVKLRSVSPGYFRTMGLSLRAGRLFDDTDAADAPGVVVINESMARKYFPNENPLGKRVTRDSTGRGPFSTIIGVVNDVRYMELGAPFEPELYRDYRQFFFAGFAMTLVLRTQFEDPMRVAAAVQREIRDLSPNQPIGEIRPMSRVVSNNVSQPRFYTLLLGAYAAIALILAATGLYGVLSYTVGQRLAEIGVRMALGASKGSVVGLVVRHALALVLAGVALGLCGASALTRFLASQLYRTEPTDTATFVAAPLILIGVSLAATWVPAHRASRVAPSVILRSE